MIGADTSFLIDFFKGDDKAVSWMKVKNDLLCVNETVIYEFLCGNLKEKEKDLFLAFVSQFPVFTFDRNASIKSSSIYRDCKSKGKRISHPDAIVAGTYVANNVNKIITRNKKHFDVMKEVHIETY